MSKRSDAQLRRDLQWAYRHQAEGDHEGEGPAWIIRMPTAGFIRMVEEVLQLREAAGQQVPGDAP